MERTLRGCRCRSRAQRAPAVMRNSSCIQLMPCDKCVTREGSEADQVPDGGGGGSIMQQAQEHTEI